MLRGCCWGIINFCNYILSKNFDKKIDDILKELAKSKDDFILNTEVTIESLQEDLDAIECEIETIQDNIDSLIEKILDLQDEKNDLIEKQQSIEQSENPIVIASASIKLPIILGKLSLIGTKILKFESKITEERKDLLKLKNLKQKQIKYIKDVKIKVNNCINETNKNLKKTKSKILELHKILIKKANICKACLEPFIRLTNISTEKELKETSYIIVSCDDLTKEIKNIATMGQVISKQNSNLLNKCNEAIFSQDIVHNNIQNRTAIYRNEINNDLKNISFIYENLSKMVKYLKEYDEV